MLQKRRILQFKSLLRFMKERFILPFYSRHQEVKTSLDLSAVYETFYVASIDRFPV